MAHPLHHLTHGISTRRTFHPAKTASAIHPETNGVKASPHRLKWMLSRGAPADPSDPWNSHAAPVSPLQQFNTKVLVPEAGPPQDARPIRSENRAILVASIARGRRWLDELIADPTANTESIAGREGCSVRKVNMTISLALLASPSS